MRIAPQLPEAHHLRIKRLGAIKLLYGNREVDEA
jgi:hypothetical protein